MGSSCPLAEASEPIYNAEYMGDGVWSVTKICPVNPQYNGAWNFYESTGELVKVKK